MDAGAVWTRHPGLAQSRTMSVGIGRAVEATWRGSFCPRHALLVLTRWITTLRFVCAFSGRFGTSHPAPCGKYWHVPAVRRLCAPWRRWDQGWTWSHQGWTWSPPLRPLVPPVPRSKSGSLAGVRPLRPNVPHLVCEMKAGSHARGDPEQSESPAGGGRGPRFGVGQVEVGTYPGRSGRGCCHSPARTPPADCRSPACTRPSRGRNPRSRRSFAGKPVDGGRARRRGPDGVRGSGDTLWRGGLVAQGSSLPRPGMAVGPHVRPQGWAEPTAEGGGERRTREGGDTPKTTHTERFGLPLGLAPTLQSLP